MGIYRGGRQRGLLLRTNKSFENERGQIGDCVGVWGRNLVGVVGVVDWKGER